MIIERHWAMPSPNTFSIPPVAKLLDRVLAGCCVVVDPFARNSVLATLTNDLNPDTTAEYHLDAEEFCQGLQDASADAVLLDPPYSPRQIAEVYQQIGKPCGTKDTQNGRLCAAVKTELARALKPGGVAVSFGWNSGGFGKGRGFEMQEIHLIAHGGAHNDTIVTVERKAA